MGISINLITNTINQLSTSWYEQNRQQESRQVVRPRVSNWRPRLPVNRRLPPEVSRSLTDTDPEQLRFVKSDDTKNQRTFLSASFHSNGWFVKSLKILSPIFVSKGQLS